MRDRSLGVILTILVIFLFGLPGLTCVCLGLLSFMLYPFINTQTSFSPAWTNTAGVLGLCIGIFLVFITVVFSYLLLHRKVDTKAVVTAQSTNIDQPTPPTPPTPPTDPDEPIPPTI